MSFLVELPVGLYNKGAFASFQATSEFDFRTARALMWMSQLAYDTAHPDKIKTICDAWELARPLVVEHGAPLPIQHTRGIIAEGHGALIIAFTGTDPLVPANWFTDLDFTLSAGNLHRGFEAAAGVVWDQVRTVLASRTDQPVFIAGHSLGAALAAVTADRMLAELNSRPTAIYTYGMPRVGDAEFARRYNDTLGGATYRLVHGNDIVPTVPPSSLNFRHVGRLLTCPQGGPFPADARPSDSFTDDPPFVRTLGGGLQQGVTDFLAGRLQPSFRADRLGRMTELLPPPIADHLPDRYCHALDAMFRAPPD